MIEVNKPEDKKPNVRCYKCKAEFYVHPMNNMVSEFITNCLLHGGKCEHESNANKQKNCRHDIYNNNCAYCMPKCQHESDGDTYFTSQPGYKCKKCGEFYR